MSSPTSNTAISADEFQALEQKVLRAVELLRGEREARLAAEAEVATLRAELEAQKSRTPEIDVELARLREEREGIRQRVEKMLRQLDELS